MAPQKEEIVEKPNGSVMERHAQTIIVVIITGLLSWVGYSVADMKTTVAEMKIQMSYLQTQMQAGVDDRFRGTDWRREKERLDERAAGYAQRITDLEKRVTAQERATDKFHGTRER